MLTARADETDLVIGLGVGADDYLGKPFSMRVLVARISALLRRADRTTDSDVLVLGDVSIDLSARLVRSAGIEGHLTRTEFDLLAHLASRPPRAPSPGDPARAGGGWGDGASSRTVDSHVKALRRKLGGDVIRTVHGVGYALEVPR